MSGLINEAARLREVHRYYEPLSDRATSPSVTNTQNFDRSNVASTQQAVPDTALTAFLQLITWRLQVQRAIVSLVDRDHQYFIAESTKTGNLVDPTVYEHEGDQLWMGCTGSTTRDEALCTNTIVAKDIPGSYPSFVVTDLRNDPRFNKLPYVKGAPFFRFYAGTPLISKDGYRIGSLFVVDDRVHPPLNELELEFLGVMAKNVMKYLELRTESREQKRHTTMSKGLAAFVEGRARIPSEWSNSAPEDTGTSPSHAESIDSATSTKYTPERRPSISSRSDTTTTQAQDSEIYKGIFARASNLLRESLDVDHVIFVDTGNGDRLGISAKNVNVVSYSSNERSTIGNQVPEFDCSIKQVFLKHICQKYSLGKIWSYHEDGSFEFDDSQPMSLSSDGATTQSNSESGDTETENKVLKQCYPNARQILYAPLWDGENANREYFSACFAISEHEVPVFTTEMEVAFVRAFVNSVGVVCGRLAAAFGEKQKSEFISSMSHELRSPLHGILASTELLYGTTLDQNQKDLCDTVDICGQTLLDTLSQILDYSKVNNFLRSTHNSGDSTSQISRSRASSVSNHISNVHAGSSLHVYSECDVASLCEEALEVVSMSFMKISTSNSPSITPLTEFGSASSIYANTERQAVVVNFISPNTDWLFLCSPGAIRRIVMNLVGNSFKYTSTGSISVKLDLKEPGTVEGFISGRNSGDHVVLIQVIDTGQGMSEEFMKNKLFVPFSQESIVAPGSGLGLSLVQGIVKSLDGSINVGSTVGKGTTVKIHLPVKRSRNHSTELQSSTPSRPTSITASLLTDIKTFKIFGPSTCLERNLKESLQYYMQTWFKSAEVDYTQSSDLVFLDERDIARLITSNTNTNSSRYAIVLSKNPAVSDVRSIRNKTVALEPLRVPFGPQKLLKALQACLTRSGDLGTLTEPITTDGTAEAKSAILLKQQTSSSTSSPPKATPTGPPLDSNPHQKFQSAMLLALDLPSRTGPVQPPHSNSKHDAVPTGPCVLCVDDNAINLKLLHTFAKKLGFTTVETAEDGLQALEAARRYAAGFDVIFMDLTMPVMDGFESTRRIRKLEVERGKEMGTQAVIVALTGLASEEDQKEAFAAGVDHFVTKPLRFKDLKGLLGQWGVGGWDMGKGNGDGNGKGGAERHDEKGKGKESERRD